MNNIHEKDWAEEGWSGHTGMDSFSDSSTAGNKADQVTDDPEAITATATKGIPTNTELYPS